MRTLRSIPVLLLLAMTVTGRAAAPSLLYSFTGSADGAYPHASLAAATDGTLYGATSNGGYAPGTLGGGTIFKVTAAGALTTLYTFPNTGTNVSGPNSLLIGADGNLHGTTVNGGTNARGTVIQLAVGIPSGTPTLTPTPTATPTPTPTATPTPTPPPSSAIPAVDIHAGGSGVFSKAGGKGKLVFIRSGGDTSTALTVYYKVKGSAANGTEYTGPGGVALSGSVVIPAGETTLKLKLKALVVPDQREKIKVILKADPAGLYQLGTGTAATLFMG